MNLTPSQVWLMLIPLFGIAWQFILINRISESLKSEFSFTLDPNDLVDQLKLVIDQRNLQG